MIIFFAQINIYHSGKSFFNLRQIFLEKNSWKAIFPFRYIKGLYCSLYFFQPGMIHKHFIHKDGQLLYLLSEHLNFL